MVKYVYNPFTDNLDVIVTATDVVAGNNTEIQYNDNGSFGASPNLTFNGTTLAIDGTATDDPVLTLGEYTIGSSEGGPFNYGFTSTGGFDDMTFHTIRSNSNFSMYGGGVDGDTHRRVIITAGGQFEVGGGSSSRDCFFQRGSGGGWLFTTDANRPAMRVKKNNVGSQDIFQAEDTSGADVFVIDRYGGVEIISDTNKLLFGAGGDSSIYYDGTDMRFNSQEVGTGDYLFADGDIKVQKSGGGRLAAEDTATSTQCSLTSVTTLSAFPRAIFRIGRTDAGSVTNVALTVSPDISNQKTTSLYMDTSDDTSLAATQRIAVTAQASGSNYISSFSQTGAGVGLPITFSTEQFLGAAGLKIDTNSNNQNIILPNDAQKLKFGAAEDASINYNGTDMVFNSQEVGSGDFQFNNGDVIVNARLQQTKGADVASANDITLGNGNYFDITGTTTINTIASTDWQAGSVVILQFDASLTVAHNTAGTGASILLSGAANFSATANDTLTLVYDGTTWREVARTVI